MEPIELLKKKIKTNIIALNDQDVEGHIWWDKFLKLVRECETEGKSELFNYYKNLLAQANGEGEPPLPNQEEFNKLLSDFSERLSELQAAQPVTPAHPVNQKAGDAWLEYTSQFPKLKEFWDMIPEPANIYLRQQIDIFAGKYPLKQADSVPPSDNLQEFKKKVQDEIDMLQAEFKTLNELGRHVKGSGMRIQIATLYAVLEWLELSGLQASPTKKEEGGK